MTEATILSRLFAAVEPAITAARATVENGQDARALVILRTAPSFSVSVILEAPDGRAIRALLQPGSPAAGEALAAFVEFALDRDPLNAAIFGPLAAAGRASFAALVDYKGGRACLRCHVPALGRAGDVKVGELRAAGERVH